jgi:hypothetical protein
VMVAMRFEMVSCVPYGTFLLPSYTRVPGTHTLHSRSTKRDRAAVPFRVGDTSAYDAASVRAQSGKQQSATGKSQAWLLR